MNPSGAIALGYDVNMRIENQSWALLVASETSNHNRSRPELKAIVGKCGVSDKLRAGRRPNIHLEIEVCEKRSHPRLYLAFLAGNTLYLDELNQALGNPRIETL
jgi:hypothetical protein